MALLSFDPGYRRVWMFPRNIRDIAPWKLHQMLIVLMKCSDLNIKDSKDQQYVYEMLEAVGIKKKARTRDKNPGGTRTYLAQMSMLGLLYNGKDGQPRFTIAGQQIADGNNPMRVLQYQLLRHQYPSAYGLGQNVQIDPRMKVKPFMFILRLIQDERLGCMLSNRDLIIPVVYGHNDDCYELCVEKILNLRRKDSVEAAIDNMELDLFTPRSGLGKDIGNVKDIANTAMNYLKAAGLVCKAAEAESRRDVYVFNENYRPVYEKLKAESDSYLECQDKASAESFQRAYGRYDKLKDTRSDKDTETEKEPPVTAFVQFQYSLYSDENLFVADDEAFYKQMDEMGVERSVVEKAIAPYRAKRRSMDENRFLDAAYSGGQKANEFEKALAQLLISYGFTESYWIGRRQSARNWRGNFTDVFVKRPGTSEAGFIEAKATSSYSLGHADMIKMKNTYIGTISELDSSATLGYVVYVAGGFIGNIKHSLMQLNEATGLPFTAVTANTMLKLNEKGWSAEEIEEKVLKHGGTVDEAELAFMR